MKISDFKIITKVVKPFQIYNLYHFKPVTGFCLDSRRIQPGEAYIALKGKYQDGHDYINEAVKKKAALVIASRYLKPALSVPYFVVEDSYQALENIAVFLRRNYLKGKVLAVTGSLGKTTTKELLAFIISEKKSVLKNEKSENNILGVAKTIFSYRSQDAAVFELGTNSYGEIGRLAKIVSPDIAILTCIKPAHLEGFGSLARLKEEKISIFKAKKTLAVLNRDDPVSAKIKLQNKTYFFGQKSNNYLRWRFLKHEREKAYFKIENKHLLIIPYYLRYFVSNYLAAITAARLLGFTCRQAVACLNSFKDFAPMRMEKKEIKKYLIFNDAYNASPDAFKKAILALKDYPQTKVLVAADMLELGQKSFYYHRSLAGQVAKSSFQYCLTLGENSRQTNSRLRELGYKGARHFSCHREVGGFIKKKFAAKGCLILLKGSRSLELEKVLKFL